MSDELFTHDASRFDPGEHPTGVDVSEVEAQYAELFAEVIWDGLITPVERQRLQHAAQVFGLDPGRAAQIEQALTAAHEALHQVAVVEQSAPSAAADEAAAEHTVAPLAPATDPTLHALQRRIEILEHHAQELQTDNAALRKHVVQFQDLVEQLQAALGETLADLDAAHARLAAGERGDDDEQAGPRSRVSPLDGEAATPVATEPPAPQRGPEPSAEPACAPAPVAGADAAAPGAEDDGAADDSPEVFAARHRWRSRKLLRDSVLPPPPQLAVPAGESPGIPGQPGPVLIGPSRGDPGEIHRLIRAHPRDAGLLRKLLQTLQRADDLDRRWCIAHVLEYLGEADDEVAALHERHLTTGLVKPTRAVNEDEWHELLRHPDEDRLTGEILAEIAPAVLLGQMTAIRQSLAPELIDPSQLVDPSASTLQAARCLAWAAAFLGVRVPPVYACPDFGGLVDIVLNPKPSTRLGAQVLSGRSARELAFLAGRHLSWYRREHLLGKPTRSIRRLEDMFVAALMIGNPGLPMTPEIKKRVEPIAAAIRPLLEARAVGRLRSCFTRFVEQGGRTNLVTWLHAAERTAACAGLLLCNDLHAAERMLAREQPGGAADWMDELIVFFSAGRCSLLRKRIGIAVEPAAA